MIWRFENGLPARPRTCNHHLVAMIRRSSGPASSVVNRPYETSKETGLKVEYRIPEPAL